MTVKCAQFELWLQILPDNGEKWWPLFPYGMQDSFLISFMTTVACDNFKFKRSSPLQTSVTPSQYVLMSWWNSFLAGKLPCSSWNIHIRSGHRMSSKVLNGTWTWSPYHWLTHISSRPNCIVSALPDYTPHTTSMCTILCAIITRSTLYPQIIHR
jgi:hypothetical protein